MDRFIPKGDRYMRGGRPNLDAADVRHLWDKAQDNAETSMRTLVTSLGYNEVQFT